MKNQTRTGRIFNNTQIQKLIVGKASRLTNSELELYCDQRHCKTVFNLNYALFICAESSYSDDKLNGLILDHRGYKRWTWKHKFQVDSKVYAITTQWYDRNDEFVLKWLNC